MFSRKSGLVPGFTTFQKAPLNEMALWACTQMERRWKRKTIWRWTPETGEMKLLLLLVLFLYQWSLRWYKSCRETEYYKIIWNVTSPPCLLQGFMTKIPRKATSLKRWLVILNVIVIVSVRAYCFCYNFQWLKKPCFKFYSVISLQNFFN